MKVLITGGAGFIGSNYVNFVINDPDVKDFYDEIIVIDALTYAGDLRNLGEEILRKITFYRADITQKRVLEKIFRKERPDGVIHFAAETHVDNSIKDPERFLRTNVIGTFNLLELSRKFDIKRFLYVSTDEVYGTVVDGYATEDERFNPSSPYSASKAAAEMFVNAYKITYGLETVVVRPSNNYGPRQYPEKLIPKTIKRALENKYIPVHGDGTAVRDWTFVEDTCKAIHLVFERGRAGEAYNITSNQERKVIDVVSEILEILGKPSDLVKHVEDRPGQDRRYAMDARKIKSLGWKPRWKFEEGLNYTVKWYLQNRWALKKKDEVL